MRRRGLILTVVVFTASLCLAQTSDTELMERARRARSIALGVNLIGWDDSMPEGGWQRWWARGEQSPGFGVDPKRGARGVPALVLGGAGRRHVFGGWRYTIPAVQPGKYYIFRVSARVKGVPNIRRNILCRVSWTGRDLGNTVTPEYINSYTRGQGFEVSLEQKFAAPENAEGAVIELLVQWAPQAEIVFSRIAFEVGKAIVPRVVKVATVYWDGADADGVDESLAALCALIDRAAASDADVVLLPEAVTSIVTGLSPQDAAETLPGASFAAFARKAREHRCYIIYGVYEREGAAVYNSAVIISRDGTLAGRYRKVQVSPEEASTGVAAGDYFRTFELDFGKVGILLGCDTAFPESARVALLDGAEMIFTPMRRASRQRLEARALDNGIWIVASGVETPSLVIDPAAKIEAIAFKEIGEGVATAQIDLAKRYRRPWVGDWQNQVIHQRRTDAYLKLVQE